MQKKNLLIALVLGGLMLVQVGCTTYSYTSRSTNVDQRVINSSEATADLTIDYKKKVTATSDFQKFPNQAKQQAIYQCIMNSGIDVLVDPIFQIESRPVTGYRATVLGFAGYYKEGISGLDEVVEKKYKKEDIEKYLLLTDPNFMQYYYNKGAGENHVYNIGAAGAGISKAPAAPVVNFAPAKKGKKAANRSEEYAKAKKLRDAGIGLTCTGFFCVAGIPMWAVGSSRMKKYK